VKKETNQLEARMPKSKASNSVILIGRGNLVDAQTMGRQIGFTSKWINRMAAQGRIPWTGIRSGVKTYRRYDPVEVMAALAHGVESSDASGFASGEKKVTVRAGGNKEPRAKAC
jgi:hypothetical protein